MNSFVNFAEAHGLIIHSLIPDRWMRVPTVDHPRKRNGAYKYLGDIGFVQNHATQTEVAVWRAEKNIYARAVDPTELAKRRAFAETEAQSVQRKAAEKARWIINQCTHDLHPYLAKKGFSKTTGLVWETQDARLLVVPMRAGKDLVGCQLIDSEGNKKFLKGQRTNDACFVIGNGGLNLLCEGYATALSVHRAAAALKAHCCVIACFSAHNLVRIAKTLQRAAIVADNDVSGTGERAAKETGWPYWLSQGVGEDFNDYSRRVPLFASSQALRGLIYAPKGQAGRVSTA